MWQAKHGGTFAELKGTQRQKIEQYVRAQQTAEQILHVSCERLGLVPAGQIGRVSKRPVMILTLPERQRVVMKCV